MSLLMDALRKAEEAKKKAELEGKSKSAAVFEPDIEDDDELDNEQELPASPVIAAASIASESGTAAPDPDPSLDIEIEFEAPVPEASLIDDLAAAELSDMDSGNASAANQSEPETSIQISQPELTEPERDALVPVASELSSPAPRESKSSTDEIPAFDALSIDYAPTFESAAPVPPLPTAAPATIQTRIKPSVTSTRAPATQGQKARDGSLDDVVETESEESQRRSAQRVFAAKRGTSPLKKNLQLSAMSVAAVLLVGFGIYFYISLRTSSGIAIPIADYEFEQGQAELANAELAAANAGIAAARVTDIPLANPEPDIDASSTVAAAAVDVASNQRTTAVIGATAAPANAQSAPLNVVVTTQPTVSAPVDLGSPLPASVPEVAAVTAPTPAITAQTPLPARSSVSIANADAGQNPGAARQPGNPAAGAASPSVSTAAALQPELIEAEALVSFSRSDNAPIANPLVTSAFAAYQRGAMEQAEALYREALLATPLNRSALLGLAAIAASKDDTVTALELYSRLLARDPNDPVAKAGILEIMPSGNLQQQEQELKRLRNQYPGIAPLAYAVGNFMAQQQRWSEAQQAYFSALQLAKNDARGASVNPDYAFNLAVSLEHLGQTRPASGYYREALALSETHPAGFNLDIARQRLNSMEPVRNE